MKDNLILETVKKFPLEDIRVELDQSCSKNSKAISIYTD